ncbi:hypothetical protein KI387_043603, partial [Taxus chinensis]
GLSEGLCVEGRAYGERFVVTGCGRGEEEEASVEWGAGQAQRGQRRKGGGQAEGGERRRGAG